MEPGERLYDLQELKDLSGVTPRTVRYYIQQGLLPAPGQPGPGAKYGEGHRLRLQMIKRLQESHLPLAEIRRHLENLDDEAVKAWLAQGAQRRPSNPASEYIQALLGNRHDALPASPSQSVAMSAPAQQATRHRSQWERIVLNPDVELHLRRPLSRELNRRVEELLAQARHIFEER